MMQGSSVSVTTKKILLIVAGILLALVAVELVLRVTDPTDYNILVNDPQTGLLMYRPGGSFIDSSSCFENVATINNLGFHGPDVTIEKPPHVYRIVMIGASYLEGSQIPVANLVSSVLQDKLNADPKRPYTYEVIPIAFAGNGTLLNTLYFMRFGAQLKPDLVIDLETGGELGRDVPTALYPPRFDAQGNVILSLPASARSTQSTTLKEFARSSKLIVNLRSRLTLFSIKLHNLFGSTAATTTSESDSLFPAGSESLWPIEEKLTDTLLSQVTASHAQFMIASWTADSTATSSADELTTRLSGIAARSGFSYLDLVPSIASQEKSGGGDIVFSCNEHWSTVGHAYAGEALYEYLKAHPSLIGV